MITKAMAKKTLKAIAKQVRKELNKPTRQLGAFAGEHKIESFKGLFFIVHQSSADPLRIRVFGKPFGLDVDLEFAPCGELLTDFMSIPRWAEWMGKKVEDLTLGRRDYDRTAIIHDYGYAKGTIMVREFGQSGWLEIDVNRDFMDCLLYICLTAESASRINAQAIYRAVVGFAGAAWAAHRNGTAETREGLGNA